MSVAPNGSHDQPRVDSADETIGGWLLDGPDVSVSIQRALGKTRQSDRHRLMRGLTSAGRHALSTEVTHALRSVCNDRVIDVVINGWRIRRTLVDAAESTAARPGSRQVVALAAHDIRFDQRPTLELRVDGIELATLRTSVELSLHLVDVVAVVEGGRLVAIHGGNASVAGRVRLEGEVIASRETTLPLVASIHLGSGVPLTTRSIG